MLFSLQKIGSHLYLTSLSRDKFVHLQIKAKERKKNILFLCQCMTEDPNVIANYKVVIPSQCERKIEESDTPTPQADKYRIANPN